MTMDSTLNRDREQSLNPSLTRTMEMLRGEVLESLTALPGKAGLVFRPLEGEGAFEYNGDALFESASVIKLPVYAVVMKLAAEGKLDLSEKLLCREEDKLPSCGALQHFTGEFPVDLRTLCALMITISDNTATNLILRRFGLDYLNGQFRELGMEKTRLERLLFDAEASSRGLENRICLNEIADLLERIARGSFVSPEVSREMENLLRKQQIRHKIPGCLPQGTAFAHKTGDDTGITNDVGIVFAKRPFVLCFASNKTDVPEANRFLRGTALKLFEACSV